MKLDRNERIEAPCNQLHSFTLVKSLGSLIARAIESGIKNRVLHFGGLSKMTHYEFAKYFATRFDYDPNLIIPK
jgi:dTDP-4-dehydrorhamnose reductase